MTNEFTIKILEGLIDNQRCIIKSRNQSIKENTIRIDRLQTMVENDVTLINNSEEAIVILEESIETYR